MALLKCPLPIYFQNNLRTVQIGATCKYCRCKPTINGTGLTTKKGQSRLFFSWSATNYTQFLHIISLIHTHIPSLSLSISVQFSTFAYLTAQLASFCLSLLLFLSRCLAVSAQTEQTSPSRASRPPPSVSCLPRLPWAWERESWPLSPVAVLLLMGSSRL